jgi:hypothetical protein
LAQLQAREVGCCWHSQIIRSFLSTVEQKGIVISSIRTKLDTSHAATSPAFCSDPKRKYMPSTKTNPSKALAADAEQAIAFLTVISDLLKRQRRHFDDAVVTHCVRLINEYVEEKSLETKTADRPSSGGSGRKT